MSAAPRCVRWAFAALIAWMAAYEAVALGVPSSALFGKQVHLGVLVAGSLLCLARVVIVREERLTWALVTAALLAWSAARSTTRRSSGA
jgi:hypothetical protein